MVKVLVVDDDEVLRLTVRSALEPQGYGVTEAANGVIALELIEAKGPFDFVILDVNMPEMSGLDALARIKEINPETAVLIVTAFSNVQDAVTAIKNGAFDYLEKPVDGDRIIKMIEAANQAHRMVELASFSAPRLNFDEGRSIIGGSSPMAKIFDLIYKLSKVETSVLIRGESGTGKELVARALHFNSHRKKGPFVAVNCAAIPENLIESELFGHEKGSFTGADKKKIGKFQYANGGTIFLDEIGDISQQMQVKLLRVLQEKRFTPVGANQEVTAEVRIIAATNRPLEKMIESGTFRPDLFYRLNVLPIHLPPLRERREDIPQLVQYLLRKFNEIHSRKIGGLSKDAMTALRVYSWPGNIRELENVIEHAFIIESSDLIHPEALPEHIQAGVHRSGASKNDASTRDEADSESLVISESGGATDDLNYPALKEKFEKEFIIKALRAFNGRINQTAEHTQMTKVTLLRKLDKYGINPREFHKSAD
jgi:two-component system response regulator HydG